MTVEDGILIVDELETAPDPSAVAVVELLGDDYIRLLHPESPGRQRTSRPTAWPVTPRRSAPCWPVCRDGALIVAFVAQWCAESKPRSLAGRSVIRVAATAGVDPGPGRSANRKGADDGWSSR